jgi:hypothetical protein
MANRLASGTTSIPVGGPGSPRLAAVGTLVAVKGLSLGLSVGILNGLKLVASDVETEGLTRDDSDGDPDGNPITVDVDNGLGNLSDEFRTDGVLDGSLVGITIGAAVGVATEGLVATEGFTDRPGADSDGEFNGVVETKGFTNRPGDGSGGESDGEPRTIGAAVELDTEGSTNRLVGSSDVLPSPTEITIGASVDVVDTECPVPSCAKVTSVLSFSDAATFCLEGNFYKGDPPP